jgi:predicted nucleic acid-binding protein
MELVYLETTFISYLVALPARDILVSAHQQVTRDWWQLRRDQFRCVVSPVVIDEISLGDKSEVAKRHAIVDSLDILETSSDAESLAMAIMDAGILPAKAVRDAAHIAVAAVHGVNYLLAWNCRHIANAKILKRIQTICDGRGFDIPLICTPEELLEETEDEG